MDFSDPGSPAREQHGKTGGMLSWKLEKNRAVEEVIFW
jgi:hypothetical protein